MKTDAQEEKPAPTIELYRPGNFNCKQCGYRHGKAPVSYCGVSLGVGLKCDSLSFLEVVSDTELLIRTLDRTNELLELLAERLR